MKSLKDIRHALSKHLGKTVTLTAYEPRNVVVEHTGTLSSVYPSVFVIDIDQDLTPKSVGRVSYNYSDILTGYIELQVD
ncbi:MAG: Veg family protein [Turicibacter sp.]|nr:Veg family protein [Turicibacter sp.]